MPTYTYRCESCGEAFDKRQSFSDDPLTTHETCGGSLRKVLHPVGIVFKGSGFYNTDYKNGNAAAAKADEGAKSEASAPASTDGSSDSKGDAASPAGSSSSDASSSAGSASTDSSAGASGSTGGAKTEQAKTSASS